MLEIIPSKFESSAPLSHLPFTLTACLIWEHPHFQQPSCSSVPDAPCLSCTFLQSLAPPGARPCQDTDKTFPSCLAEGGEKPPLWTALMGEMLCFLLECLYLFQQYVGDFADRNEGCGQFRPLWHSVLAGRGLYMVGGMFRVDIKASVYSLCSFSIWVLFSFFLS